MISMIPSLAVPIKFSDILHILRNSLIGQKHTISNFENIFSQYIGCKYALLTCSGSAALYVLLNAYGLKKNDEIIVPAYTCETLGRLLIDMGFAVKFVDADKKTYNISTKHLRYLISKNTKAVIAVHMFGNPCAMDSILEISHSSGAIVIEDAAQAMGAEYGNKKIGTIGDAGFFSLGIGKPITTLGGGILVTDDRKIAEKSRNLIDNLKKTNNSFNLSIFLKFVTLSLIQNRIVYGIIYKLIESRRIKRRDHLKESSCHSDAKCNMSWDYTNMQACIGLSQLSYLEQFNNSRIRNADFLIKNLTQISNINIPKLPSKCKSIYLRLPMWIEDITTNQRDELVKKLQLAGIDASVAYPNSLPDFFNCKSCDYPNTEELISKTITLPTHPLVRRSDLLKIIRTIDKYCVNLE